MSGALIFIRKEMKISEVKLEILLGSINFYFLIGSFAAERICDWIDRRYTMLVAAATFFAGAILMSCATSYTFLMLANFIASIGVGFAFTIAPLYTAELSPATSHGSIATFPEVTLYFN